MSAPRSWALPALLPVLLLGCSTAPEKYERDAKAQQELGRALAGRVAGAPVSCIPNRRATDMQVIDDWTILFRDGRTVYVQNPRGGCRGIGNQRNILVTRVFGTNSLCSGDIQHVVDPISGFGGGACVFGPFVPYTRTPS